MKIGLLQASCKSHNQQNTFDSSLMKKIKLAYRLRQADLKGILSKIPTSGPSELSCLPSLFNKVGGTTRSCRETTFHDLITHADSRLPILDARFR